jgi:hypothetical protein
MVLTYLVEKVNTGDGGILFIAILGAVFHYHWRLFGIRIKQKESNYAYIGSKT